MSNIPDIIEHFDTPTVVPVPKAVTMKNQMVNAPANGTVAVFAVVLAPKDGDGKWVPGEEKLKRFEDDPLCPHPILGNLASLFQAMQFMSIIDVTNPNVAALRGYILQEYQIDIAEHTNWDVAKLLSPILDDLNAKRLAARPEGPTPFPVPIPPTNAPPTDQ